MSTPTPPGLSSVPTVTIGTVPCWEEAPEEHFAAQEDNWAKRRIVCNWLDRGTLLTYLRGGIVGVKQANGTTVGQWIAPAVYPDVPWLTFCKADVEPVYDNRGLFVGVNGMSAAQWARITAEYRTLEFNITNQTGATVVDFAAEGLAVPTDGGGYTWAANGSALPNGQDLYFRYPDVDFVITRANQYQIPTSLIFDCTGCVNSVTFQGAAAEQILFNGAKSQHKWAMGVEQWDLTYSFSYRSASWNKQFNGKTGLFDYVQQSGTNVKPYGLIDLNQLLQ